jgi:alkylated DNA repair dioxygenase AlkB
MTATVARLLRWPPFPPFLLSLRSKVAALVNRPEDTFRQVLITEYRPGAGMGWQRDKAQFDEVVGVSLLAPCAALPSEGGRNLGARVAHR